MNKVENSRTDNREPLIKKVIGGRAREKINGIPVRILTIREPPDKSVPPLLLQLSALLRKQCLHLFKNLVDRDSHVTLLDNLLFGEMQSLHRLLSNIPNDCPNFEVFGILSHDLLVDENYRQRQHGVINSPG
jgi:hypothetical protein